MIWTALRLRGWTTAALLTVAGLVLSLAAGAMLTQIPFADGPRRVVHYQVVFTPALAARVLADACPELSRTLVREQTWRLAALAAYWAACAVSLPGLLGADITTRDGLYATVIALWLGAITLATTTRWETPGTIAALLAGLIWLAAGNTLAPLFGFDLTGPEHLRPLPWASLFLAAAAALTTTTAVAVRWARIGYGGPAVCHRVSNLFWQRAV